MKLWVFWSEKQTRTSIKIHSESIFAGAFPKPTVPIEESIEKCDIEPRRKTVQVPQNPRPLKVSELAEQLVKVKGKLTGNYFLACSPKRGTQSKHLTKYKYKPPDSSPVEQT